MPSGRRSSRRGISRASSWPARSPRATANCGRSATCCSPSTASVAPSIRRRSAKACGLPLADPKATEVNKEIAEQVDEKVARKFYFIPVAEQGGKIVVWGADCSQAKRDAAEAAAGKKFEWFATDPKTITSYMEQMWRSDADISRLVASFQETDAQHQAGEDALNEVSLDDQAPVVQLVSRIVGQALRDRASDIHIEPLDEEVRVRFRIDGQLVEAVQPADVGAQPARRAASRSCRR